MILPYQWIIKHGPDIITPFDKERVNPASYDVALEERIYVKGKESMLLPYIIMPQEFIIASTREYVKFPLDVAGDLKLKSSIGRMGINHALSGWFDPGFEGNATLELQNISGWPVQLVAGMKIAQLVFMQLTEATCLPYEKVGRYCKQVGPTLARAERQREMP